VHGATSSVLRAADVALARFVPAAELVSPPHPSPRASGASRTVMVTGASGFLGRFVLLELLERGARVVGLVRAKDDAAARARVAASFATDPELSERFESLARNGALAINAGDLMLPELGLPQAVYGRLATGLDGVIHVGALVNHALGYDELFEPNVRGTAEIARFAMRGTPKNVAFVSTVGLAEGRAAAVRASESAGALWPERARFGGGPGYGYTSTKWASELLLAELGARSGTGVQLLRATNLMAHSRYRGQVNAEDFLCRLLSGLALTGVAPASFYAPGTSAPAFDGVAVDAAARAVVDIALGEPDTSATYHLAGAASGGVSLDTIVDCLSERVPLERIADYGSWYRSFTERLATLDAQRRRHSPLVIAERWQKPQVAGVRLEANGAFDVPALTPGFIHKLLDDLVLLGVL
jgi:fatty acid CoA ligase FadD9